MSLKKLFVIPAALTIAFGAVDTASAGDVVSACKAVNGNDTYWVGPVFMGSKCGGRQNLRWIMGATGLGTGAATGMAAGSIFGPFGMAAGALAGGWIGGNLGGRIGVGYSADEYIYMDGNYCLECDEHQTGEDWECPQGTIVTNGTEVYKCDLTQDNDRWEKIDLHICSASPVQQANLQSNGKYRTYIKDSATQDGIQVRPGVKKYSGAACIWIEEDRSAQNNQNGGNTSGGDININILINSCVSQDNGGNCNNMNSQTQADCAQDPRFRGNADLIACCMHEKAGLTTMSEGVACSCRAAGYTWSTTEHTCVKGRGSNSGGSCEGYRSHPERYACCKAGQDTYWEGNLTDGKCICGSPRGANARQPNGKVWTWNGGTTGYCADPTNPDPHDPDPHNPDPHNPDPHNPDPHVNTSVTCNYNFGVKVKCKNGASLEAAQSWSFTFSSTDGVSVNQNGMCVLPLTNNLITASTLMQRFCAEKGSVVYDGPDDAAVEAAKSSLQSFFQTAQSTASVWKDSEGKFNTARLASDGAAAVVLGTVGGVVSSKVIKKKQLEKGYDALNCTIGGYNVAGWGDTFQVGYTR